VAEWRSSRARPVLAALYRIGWQFKREASSHKALAREAWPGFVFASRDHPVRFAPIGAASSPWTFGRLPRTVPPNEHCNRQAIQRLRALRRERRS
jgi:hypothetical protein